MYKSKSFYRGVRDKPLKTSKPYAILFFCSNNFDYFENAVTTLQTTASDALIVFESQKALISV